MLTVYNTQFHEDWLRDKKKHENSERLNTKTANPRKTILKFEYYELDFYNVNCSFIRDL